MQNKFKIKTFNKPDIHCPSIFSSKANCTVRWTFMPIKLKNELSELSKKELHKSIKGKLVQKKERISLTELISNIFEYVSNIDAPWYKFPIHTKEKNITPNTNKPMKNKLPHLKKNFVFSKKIFRTIFFTLFTALPHIFFTLYFIL